MSIPFSALTEAAEYRSAGRTITDADIVNFAGISGDFNPLHTDDVWVRENTKFDGRIAHGLLVLAVTNGLRTPGVDDWNIQAFVNVERRMIGPVYPGDTLHSSYKIENLRASRSRPGAGIVTVRIEVLNQHGDVVQDGQDKYLVGGTEDQA